LVPTRVQGLALDAGARNHYDRRQPQPPRPPQLGLLRVAENHPAAGPLILLISRTPLPTAGIGFQVVDLVGSAMERLMHRNFRLYQGWGPIVAMVNASAPGPYTHQMRHAEGVRFST